MNKKLIGLILFIGLIFAGCSTEDYFGKLSDKELIQFQLEEQLGNSKITEDTIYITVSEDAYLFNISNLSASRIKVSDYATVSPQVGEKKDFSQPVVYTITAEDGSTKEYYVVVQRGGSSTNLQLPNSSFDFWYTGSFGGNDYIEIGKDKDDKTWGTGNEGAILALGSDAKLPTEPYETGLNKFAAELTTADTGFFGSIAGKGVAAGNIFTGRFEIGNVMDAHPVFGTPYTQKPVAFKIDYQYTPAEGLKNGKRESIDGKDAMDMYLILEKREGENVKRLGVGWYRSGETQTEWATKEIEIKYARNGKAPEGVEEYAKHVLKYGHDGDTSAKNPSDMADATWGDITDKPTHILVVFTSSYLGDYFIGAPGSKLLVDNFELIY